ncbi:siderophore ABC transporter substrate-binding protein [Paraliobacillus ryukyuensis]|uniref:siderophore ABC transporter substrate-binding protein n=1 Tax=Paraliobacillus ryukyuensis TaxID=200904 RepID=UPI0009A61992|nr:siderophore ABC transporter substrate-binding protein [Paraliobacillus ryukyuensis]
MKRIVFFLSILGLLIFTAACGSSSEETKASSNSSTDDTTTETEEVSGDAPTEIEVEHELGTTTVPVNPEKVIVFDYGTLETLNELGVEVTGVPQGNLPPHLEKYESSSYENAGTLFEPDFEKLATIEPDLIIISGRSSKAYEELSELAPTIYMGVDAANYLESFQANVKTLGKIFSMEDKAQEKLDGVMATVDEVKSAAASTEGKGLIILTNDGSVSAYGPGSRFGFIHDELGITPVDDTIEASNHGQSIGFEYIAEKNPDYLFVVDRNTIVGGEASAAKTLDNDLVNGTNAAKNDNIVYLDPYYWYVSGGGLTSVQEMANQIKQAIQ